MKAKNLPILLLIFTLFTLFSCKNPTTEIAAIANDSTASTYDDTSEEYDDNIYTELRYVITAAQGYNYDSLKQIAQEVSMLLHWPIDSMGRLYSSSHQKIIVPENSTDEMWAGEYFFRRDGENYVSVEMQSAYIDTLTAKNKQQSDLFYQDEKKMFVCAGVFANENDAKSVLSRVQTEFPKARIIPTEIYMGCMH